MAEDKKGFLLYADYIETFRYLSNDQRGEVMWWILQYVNDLSPEPLEGALMAVIANIREQLKRDLRKYELKTGKNSENGRIGNLKRWNFDLFEAYKKGKHTLEEAEIIANDRKESQPDRETSPPDKNVSPPIAKIADTDNDNVTDKDKDIKTTTAKALEQFNEFWSKYPKKVGRKDCENKFIKLSNKDREAILSTVEAFAKYKQFDTYTHPNPLTYLNAKRWEDVIPTTEIKEPKKSVEQTYFENVMAQVARDEAREAELKNLD